MGFKLDEVVPWGRSYEEYIAMFDLSGSNLKQRILSCGDGPAAFNAELTRRGGTIVSVDPVYAFEASQIRKRISETYETVMAQMRENQSDFIWDTIASVDELGAIRMEAMDAFLMDYEKGKREGRYIEGKLPTLSLESRSFDVALSSHFLFLYSDHLSASFHLQALLEMLRVAHEVRVFPLLALDSKPSPHMGKVIEQLHAHGFGTEIRTVSYEFQRGGNEMLTIRKNSE